MKPLNTAVILAALVTGLSASSVSAIGKTYTLKGDKPLGSNIRATLATSPIPFNKRYQELSSEQQEWFNTRFNQLSPDQTPPFPARGLRAIYKPILQEARHTGSRGELSLVATVNPYGEVLEVAIHQSPNEDVTQRAIRTLRSTRFDPALCAGEACQMNFPVHLKF